MWEGGFNLVKLDSELAKKIYDDVFSPALKKAWNALWDIIWLVTNITIPIAMMNNYSNFILQKNIEKYEKKLEQIKEEDRIKVLPEIWVPILDKLTYYNNEKLSDLFLELLKKASNKNEVTQVHPKFIKIIENLSEDEAIILEYFYKNNLYRIPYIDIQLKKPGTTLYLTPISYYSELNNLWDIKIKENINNYVENLISLWIFQNPDGTYIWGDETIYTNIEQSEKVVSLKNNAKEAYKDTEYLNEHFKRWQFRMTNFWMDFLRAIFTKST